MKLEVLDPAQLDSKEIPELLNEEIVRTTLEKLLNSGVLACMRAGVNELGSYFDPNMEYVSENEASKTRDVLDRYRIALIEGNETARQRLFVNEVEHLIVSLEPGSVTRRILIAFWKADEDAPWIRTKNRIHESQSFRHSRFSVASSASEIFSRLQQKSE